MSNRTKRCRSWFLAAAAVLGMSLSTSAWAYTQSSTNPRYFEIRGQSILPIGSEEHYGSVVNKCFDYKTYLDSMAGYDQTMTQVYGGGWYIEANGHSDPSGCGNGDPLRPSGDSLLTPWSWNGSKYDLDTWNAAYFARLHDFMQRARDRGIMVMFALGNGMYGDNSKSPLYGPNSVQNNTGTPGRCDFQYIGNVNLFNYQARYIKKIVYELNSYDNLEYFVVDEPNTGGCDDSRINAWASALIDTLYNYEGTLPQRHAITIDGDWGATKGLSDNPHLSGQNDHGHWYADADRSNRCTFGNEQALAAGTQHQGECWGLFVNGGASIQQLSWVRGGSDPIWVGREGGSTNQRTNVWPGMRALSRFANSVNFVNMTRNVDIQVTPAWGGLVGQTYGAVGVGALGDSTNHEYVIYRNRDNCTGQSCTPGALASEDISLRFPNGTYKYEWVSVLDASVMGSGTFTASGSNTVLTTPPYQMGIALRVKQTNQAPTIPHIRLPWSGRTGLPTNPKLTWWGVWDATSIHCQVSANPDMSSPTVNDSSLGGTAVSKTLSGLSNNATFYWRVRSKNGNGVSAWSPIWRFGTGGGSPPTFQTVRLIPSAAMILLGETQQFTATALDQHGSAMDPQPSSFNWTLTGDGDLSASGLYTAPDATGGTYTIKAEATLDGVTRSGSTTILVTAQLPGLNYDYYEGTWGSLPNFASLTPVNSGMTGNFGINAAQRSENFGFHFFGQILIPEDGMYTFSVSADDEAMLEIDGQEQLLVHWSQGQRSTNVDLTAGLHPIALSFYQGGGGVGLDVGWTRPGGVGERIPDGALFLTGGATVASDFMQGMNLPTISTSASPSGGTLRLVVTGKGSHALRVTSLSGRILHRFTGRNRSVYSLGELPKGAHVIEGTAGGMSVRRRVVVR